MPAPRLLPDNDMLLQLRDQNWPLADIAGLYGVSVNAVYRRLRTIPGAIAPRPRYADLLPWRLDPRHAHARPAQMLRLYGRRRAELSLTPHQNAMLDRFLAELTRADVVVCYHRDTPPNAASPLHGGFYHEPRQPTDGDNLVRCDTDTPAAIIR